MQLHNLKRITPRHHDKIVGRGGKRGTTAGRGTKGQKARSGHRIRPESRDAIKRLPKKRGYRFLPAVGRAIAVPLARLKYNFVAGEVVSPASLSAKRLISAKTLRRGTVKLIGSTSLTVALVVENCLITPSAKKIIEKAGGKVLAAKTKTVTSHAK